MCVCVHLCSTGRVTRISEQQPLVNEAVLYFVVDQPKVKLEGANESIRNYLLGIEHLHFCESVKHLVRTFSKIEEQHLRREARTQLQLTLLNMQELCNTSKEQFSYTREQLGVSRKRKHLVLEVVYSSIVTQKNEKGFTRDLTYSINVHTSP